MFRSSVQFNAAIVCDAARAAVPVPAIGDWHDVAGHHRYYGGSASNGGEQILESRNGRCFWNPVETTTAIDDLASAFVTARL